MKINTYINSLRQKGDLAYEYNPLYNYQTNVDLYKIDNKFIVPEGQAVNPKNGELLTHKNISETETYWVDKNGRLFSNEDVLIAESGILIAKAGSIIDLDTEQLDFDLEHPVDIEVQPSYDGSVNLIINDDKNIPRLINSRFAVQEKNTYKIIDRIDQNSTNIYNSKTFDKDSALYFQYTKNPIIKFKDFIQGNFGVGQYVIYLTYCDSDENESDYVSESPLIPIFIGSNGDPFSIDGGIKNENSQKGIKLEISNIDLSYDYFKVYIIRYFADYQQNRVVSFKKLFRKYPILGKNTIILQLSGEEEYEELDPNILNLSRFNPKHVLTQAQCKNMLFFGNIVKNSDNYKELRDCALRIIPTLKTDTIDLVTNDYLNNSEYYNIDNIINKTGYFDQEYYRFGIVFVYNNGTLSNVYNTLGLELNLTESITYNSNKLYSKIAENPFFLKRNYIEMDDFGWIKNYSTYFTGGKNLNGKGVCYINAKKEEYNNILGIEFKIPQEVKKHLLEDLDIRGFFFVRQKCTPTILAQCYLLPMDPLLQAPVIEYNENGTYKKVSECFITQESREVKHTYEDRIYQVESEETHAYAAICPDFLLNQPYYNQIFNGNTFSLNKITEKESSNLKKIGRFYKESDFNYRYEDILYKVKINTVTDDVPTVAIKDKIYRLEIGETEEVYRFRSVGEDKISQDANKQDKGYEAENLVRGKYSPYLAIYSDTALDTSCLYNIYQDNFTFGNIQNYQVRMDSSEPFYAISNIYNFTKQDDTVLTCWKGDCYTNTFTFRLNRNFNDPALPNNDEIIDEKTWRDNYKSDSTLWTNISRSDINAVKMGSWITIKLKSAMNYALRSEDHSYVSEEALMGAPRSFYPRSFLLQNGENKMPDSYLYNDAYRASLGYKCYFTLQDVNYIKDTFSNRIQYSAISIQDSFKNNYRYSLSTYFRDYSQEYGSITRLVGFEGYLLVVFEHGIGIAVINERILSGQSDGEPVFINTNNVLPEELTIITDTYGSQWSESIIKSESGYVYGVDTIAKKIWRVKGQQIEILSDFRIGQFLNENITLTEKELHPIIGLKNVKTHYNNNKKDVMFTFYDNIYQDEEKVWNICYNELLEEFITFYSWVPSYSENIDTQYFSFNRNTAKGLSLLGKCNFNIPKNTGVLLDTPVLNIESEEIKPSLLYYRKPAQVIAIEKLDGQNISTGIENIDFDYETNMKFELVPDHWGNYKYFNIYTQQTPTTDIITLEPTGNQYELSTTFSKEDFIKRCKELHTSTLFLIIKPIKLITKDNKIEEIPFNLETIAVTLKTIVDNPLLLKDEDGLYAPALGTDFYLHGQSGIIDITENTYPCYWYNEQHPFEFEFIVNDKISYQKLYNNLLIISNKAEPESFHFEIEGDNYDWSSDKRTMYWRQEATKNLFQELGSNILYDRKYKDVQAFMYTQEEYYRRKDYSIAPLKDVEYPIHTSGLTQQNKSTIFPLYYERIDTYNDVYHIYRSMLSNSDDYDFKNLSGSEIKWNRKNNQFDIVTHIKNSPIDKHGRLRGNSHYKEGRWDIQIPSISLMQKNEDTWKTGKPPIVINSSNIPNDLTSSKVDGGILSNIYSRNINSDVESYISIGDWSYRKETKLRDKWIKVRIRYSGKNIAIIHSIITLYNLSYA